MNNEVAIFLDLDNLVIGAKQLNIAFDINLILDQIKEVTGGRIVLRRAYGDWRQNRKLLQDLTAAGFVTQSTVPLNNYGKNLADMQIVVDCMETLVSGLAFQTYVLLTGDRDFTPLVQSLHKRGRRVLGIGMRHAASRTLVNLCDQYLFYEDLIPSRKMTEAQVQALLTQVIDDLFKTRPRVRASVLKQHMNEASRGAFDSSQYAERSFRKFLSRYPDLIEIQQEGTTTYVRRPALEKPPRPLHLRYRSELKRKRLRILPAAKRLTILKDAINTLSANEDLRWRQLVDLLFKQYRRENRDISKNMINSLMLVARQAQVIRTVKDRSLAAAPVLLELKGDKPYQEAIIRCDAAYLSAILDLPEYFDLQEAALALYDDVKYAGYLQQVMDKWMGD